MPVLMPRALVFLPVFCALLGLPPSVTAQQQVYKWTDAAGNITYSDQPPPAGYGAEQLQMPAAPSAADVDASRERTEAMQRRTEELAQERRLREQRAAEAAQQAAAQAKAAEPVEKADSYNNNSYYNPNYPSHRPIIRPRPPRPLRPTRPIARPRAPHR